MKQMERFLGPTPRIDSDNESIRRMAEDLTQDQDTDRGKAKSLYYWVRDEIGYTPLVPLEIFDDYRASATLKRGKGFCVEKAAVLTAFSRAVGIPARVHLADIRNQVQGKL